MNLAVIDTGVFVSGVFWHHEPHLCLKAWLRGLMTPVMTEEILAEYEAVLGTGKTGAAIHNGYRALAEYPANVSLVGYARAISRQGVPRPQGQQIH